MKTKHIIAIGILSLLVLAVIWVSIVYHRDMSAAKGRIQANSHIVETDCGPIEYAETGNGKPVLVLHGAGGGYDQGLLLGKAFLGQGYRVIAPSRYGYLNAGIPQDSSLEAQADAFACLLDELGIERVPVISVSAGGIPSLYFALRHPERTEALVLVSAVSYTEETAADHAKEDGIKRLVSSDFVYWAAIRSTPASMLKLFGVTGEVQARMSPVDKEYAHEVLDAMLPMSLRWGGILLDQSRQIGKDIPLTQIQVPTLVVHAQDDTLVAFSHGEYSASQIPGAKLVTLEDGGHFLLGHYEEVNKSVTNFLAESTLAADN